MTPAIRSNGLWKEYRVGQRLQPQTFYDMLSSALTLRRSSQPQPAAETFWALRDLSFEIPQGEVLGVIGRNGAGKSTLLKILTRITAPTRGRIEVRGKIASLLEVGTGFHPELTGRENIFLNGAILGMGRREIERKFDEIVAFAEVEQFLDTPVKRYSSGMYVRLAFAVAAHLDADVLLVDEVLAVGDAEFQEKCLGRMRNVSGQGRTVLFVSHNMGVITDLCSSCMLLDKGEIRRVGPPESVIHEYFSTRMSPQDFTFRGPLAREILITSIRINGDDGSGSFIARPAEPIRITIEGVSRRSFNDVQFVVTLSTKGIRLATMHDAEAFRPLAEGEFTVDVTIPPAFLRPGAYLIGVGADRERIGVWCYGDNLVRLTIAEEWSAGYPPNRRGLINLTAEQVNGTRTSTEDARLPKGNAR